MGGIATINDVLEFIMAGATGIAIGTEILIILLLCRKSYQN